MVDSGRTRIAVLASGSGTNLQAIIDEVEAGTLPVEIALVLSDKADAFAIERAKKHDIETVHVDPKEFKIRSDYDDMVLKVLKDHRVDLVVLAGYMLLIGKQIVAAYPGRIMNIHPSLLPSFPGLHGAQDALDYGVKVTGVTVHFVDEGLDTGPIIVQGATEVQEDDTKDSLLGRLHEIEHKLYPKAIGLFAEGRLKNDGRRIKICREER